MAKRTDPAAATPEQARTPIFAIYEEVIGGRDRLAGLPPLTAQDLSSITLAMHEAVWFFLRPPRSGERAPTLPTHTLGGLTLAARDRSGDLFTTLVAALALKLAGRRIGHTAATLAEDVLDGIESLTFDFRATKATTLDRLSAIKAHVDDRIAYVRRTRRRRFAFSKPPERYRDRPNKRETPDRFLRRVYGADLKRGLTQADIRDADPRFYNVLHVWCTRHRKRMADLVPTSRARPR